MNWARLYSMSALVPPAGSAPTVSVYSMPGCMSSVRRLKPVWVVYLGSKMSSPSSSVTRR